MRSVVPFGRKSRYAELLSIPVCSAAIDAVPSSKQAAIMVNKFFIRINSNYVGFMLQIYAHRAQCVHFITQQKLTNHYNENSTIKAKPLIFSGLDSFFTFFKPRHPISVKKLRANRRFPPFSAVFRRFLCGKGAVGCRHSATCIQRPPCSHSSSVWGSDWRIRISSALRPLRVSRSAARPCR